MKIYSVNPSIYTKIYSQNTKANQNPVRNSQNVNNTYTFAPYQIPIISFRQTQKMTDNSDYNTIIKNGFELYSETTIMNESGNMEKAYVFSKRYTDEKTPGLDHVEVVLMSDKYAYLGAVSGFVQNDIDKKNHCYLAVINNFANTHNEKPCDAFYHDLKFDEYGNRSQTKYKQVGAKLCEAFESLIRRDFPEVKYVECCPVRDGSTKFFKDPAPLSKERAEATKKKDTSFIILKMFIDLIYVFMMTTASIITITEKILYLIKLFSSCFIVNIFNA